MFLSCARIIFAMGILKIVYLKSYGAYKGLKQDEGLEFLNRFGIETQQYQGNLENVTHMI